MLKAIERDAYIAKLERIVEGIDRILELQGNRITTPEMREELKKQQEKARMLLPKLRTGEFEIAVIGLEKAGKSSFANALTGLPALPTDEPRCTYTSTCIMPGLDDEAEVTFYTKEEFDQDFQEKLEMIGIPGAKEYTLYNLGIAKYQQLFNHIDEAKQSLYKNSLHQDILATLKHEHELRRYIGAEPKKFTADQLDTDDFRAYITQPNRAIAVKDIVIRSTRLKAMPNAILFDVPGFNSPTARHRQQTFQKMNTADAIIMVAKADEPSLTEEVLGIFEHPDDDGLLLAKKLFIFANKADRADNLQANREVTYHEWIDERKILEPGSEGRIVFGSAAAYLGELDPHGIDARQILARKHIDNGIDHFREVLQNYYDTDRFNVLKQRVEHIVSRVQKTFQQIESRSFAEESSSLSVAYSKMVLGLHETLKHRLAEDLRTLRLEVNERARREHPLSQSIAALIAKSVTPERYDLQKDEIASIHREIAGVGIAEQPVKLDTMIREERFQTMYKDFSEEVLACTDVLHKSVCDRILEAFLQALQINPEEQADAGRERIMEDAAQLCGLHFEEGASYYQSLIERFARDLFEIQIKFARNDRLEKFKEDIGTFLSLEVFYDAAHNPGALTGSSETACVPVWGLLLYPELLQGEHLPTVPVSERKQQVSPPQEQRQRAATEAQAKQSNAAFVGALAKRVVELTGIDAPSASVIKLLGRLAEAQGDAAMQIIEETFTAGFRDGVTQSLLPAKVRVTLASLLEARAANTANASITSAITRGARAGTGPAKAANKADTRRITPPRTVTPNQEEQPKEETPQMPVSLEDLLYNSAYQESVAARHREYSYDQVRQEFHDDVLALREVLEKGLVPAIDVDKAFSAHESLVIENAIRALDSKEFREFIVRNAGLVEAQKGAQLHDSMELLAIDGAVMHEIQTILDDITSNIIVNENAG